MWKGIHSIGDSFGVSLCDIDAVATVAFGGTTDIPSRNPMRCPGVADIGGFIDENFGARRREGGAILVKGVIGSS